MSASVDFTSSAGGTAATQTSSHTFASNADGILVRVPFGSTGAQVVSSVKIDPGGANEQDLGAALGIVENSGGGENPRVEFFGAVLDAGVRGKTLDVEVVLSAAPDDQMGFGAVSLIGSDGTFGTFASATGTCDTTPSVTISDAGTDEQQFDGVAGRRQDSNPNAGQTEDYGFVGSNLNCRGAKLDTPAASPTMGWGCDGGGAPHWAIAGMSANASVAVDDELFFHRIELGVP
jgi:hypothetical protein